MTVNPSKDLNWLLDDLVRRAVGVDRAVVLSTDGLLLGHSQGLQTFQAEHLAAVAAAFQSLAKGTGKHFAGGGVQHTVVEMEHAFLMVCAAGAGACIAVFATSDADLGLIAYEVHRLVGQVHPHLSVPPRPTGAPVDAQAS